jgi:hypothetical protein
VGASGVSVHPFDGAARGTDGGAAVLRVEVFDVEGEDLGDTGGGLVEHPPQRLLAQRDVAARQQPLDLGFADGLSSPRRGPG